jgi:hypothetical protein
MSGIDLLAEKRRVRLQIGRTRRRIDGRLRGLERQGRRMVSWPTWVLRLPAQSLVAALGVGLAAGSGVWRKRRLRALGRYLARRAGGQVLAAAIRALADLWTHWTPRPEKSTPTPSGGVDHG